jgi:outer membrane protein assembly factor BamB
MTKTLAILIILALLLSIGEPIIQIPLASANGYPGQWPMFRFDQQHSGRYPWATPTSNETLWTYSTGGSIFTSPAVSVAGIVYFGANDGKVYAVQAADGSPVWNYTTGGEIVSSPAAVDGMVFIGSNDNRVYCLSALTGTQLWNYTTNGDIYSSPTVCDGYVFIGSDDQFLYKLDEYTGSLIWCKLADSPISVSPAVYNNVIWFGTDAGTVYCIDEDNGMRYWNFTAGAGIYSSPSYADGYIFVGSSDYHLYCLNGVTGTEIWNFTDSSQVHSSPAAYLGLVYFGTYSGNFYCLNASTGTQLWNYTMHGGYSSSPAVADYYNCVYVSSFDTIYAFYTIPGPWLGKVLWSYYVSPMPLSSVALFNSTLFIGSSDGNLYAFKSTPRGITFDASGVPAGTPGTILLIDGLAEYTLADLPVTITPNMGETVTFQWNPVWTADDSEQYGWKSGSGLNQTLDHGVFVVTEMGTIEAVYYLARARVTFTILNVPVGWGQNNTGFCLTVNGRLFYRTDFDAYGDMNLTFASSETFTYEWTAILADQVGNNYTFRECSGLSTTRVGSIYVTHAGSLIGRYEGEYVLVAFQETGLPIGTFWVTVDGTEVIVNLAQFRWQYGLTHSYSIAQNVTVSGTIFYLTNVSGLTQYAGYSITATVSGVIDATYSDSHTLWGESDLAATSLVATEHAKEWKEFYAAGRFWLMTANATNKLILQSAPYVDSTIGTWSMPVYFGPPGVNTKTQNFTCYYESIRGFIHCAFAAFDYGFWYRRGLPNSDGTITWTTSWQHIHPYVGGEYLDIISEISLVVSSSGAPFVGMVVNSSVYSFIREVVVYTTTNTGIFSDPIIHDLCAMNDVIPERNVALASFNGGKVLAVFLWYGTSPSMEYRLQSEIWSGSAWSTAVYIVPPNAMPITGNHDSIALAANQTWAYLSYLSVGLRDLYAFKYVVGVGWSSVQTVLHSNTGFVAFPAVAFRGDGVEIYWTTGGNTIYGSWLNGTSWTAAFTVKELNATSTNLFSLNSFINEIDGKFGMAITFQRSGHYYIAMIYQPSPIPTWQPAPSGDNTFYGVPWPVIFFLFGAICLIVGIVYTIKGIKEGDKAEALNGFMAIFIGLGMFLGALL